MSEHAYLGFRPGNEVTYIPLHAEGDVDHPDCEDGFVSSISPGGETVFVRFFRRGDIALRTIANSESCPPERLVPTPNHRRRPPGVLKSLLAQFVKGDLAMTGNSYQLLASRTLITEDETPVLQGRESRILWNTIGLVGEAGELANYVKKGIYHNHSIDRKEIANELGDILWYLAAIATVLDIRLETIMEQNIDKLRARYPQGFSSQDSIRRVDTILENSEGSDEPYA